MLKTVDDFINQYGIREDVSDRDVYEAYTQTTDHPVTKTAFTQYLKAIGFEHVRKSQLGKRFFIYRLP